MARSPSATKHVLVLIIGSLLYGCGGCGLMVYCAYDGANPPAHIFTVNANGTSLVGHRDGSGSSFATEARFPAGKQIVWVARDDGDEEDGELTDFHAFEIHGSSGDVFDVSCFQYSGRPVLKIFTEVLYGYEIHDQRTGALIDRHPAGVVNKRSSWC